MHFGGRLTPEQFWQHMSDLDAGIRAAFPSFPVYGLPAWPASRMLAEWGYSNDVLTTAGLLYGDPDSSYVHVRTTIGNTLDEALSAHATVLGDLPPGEPASQWTTTVPVDGEPVEFTTWSAADRFIAAAPTRVVLEWRGVDPATFALARIDDLEPYLEGRHAYIRRLRGED